jgi:riboflavin synthase
VFTGIVEERGKVEAFDRHKSGARLLIGCRRVLSDMTLGASIAVNGVCLTAIDIREDGFSADLSPETLDRSTLGELGPGARVNLERPLSLQARLGGHLVQGHVDGTGTIDALREIGDGNWELLVRVPQELERLLVYKGSITVDGISLTIAAVDGAVVKVAIIPHTYEVTNLSSRRAGDRVNIECDLIARYVARLLENVSLK